MTNDTIRTSHVDLKAMLLATVSVLVIGAGTPAAFADAAAPAADSSATDVTEVVVTGYRKSLEQARTIKRDANIEVDAIVAEDMAKFPELNLAESLQRLPGVQITREAGEGRRISLRGLGPDFARVQLNGMEVLGNVDSAQDSRGQRSRDRALDFNIFASELFSKVQVEKTFQASQNEGGMAGTVGLFTGKPFDYAPGVKGALIAKIGTNEYSKDTQPRIVGLFSRNWDNKFGVAFSVAYAKRQTTEQGHNDYNYSSFSGSDVQDLIGQGLDITHLSSALQTKLKDPNQTFYFADGNRLSSWNAKLERLGLTGAAQWRPNDKTEFTLDVLHSEFTTHRDELHLATRPLNGIGSTTLDGIAGTPWPAAFQKGTVLNNLVLDANNFATYTDASNVTLGSEHRRELNHNRFTQAVLTGKWDATDKLTIDGHVGAEKSVYDTPYDDKLYMRAKGNLIANYGTNGQSASFSYPGTNLTDPSIYAMDNFYYRSFNNASTLEEGVLNLKYKLTDVWTLRAGIAYHKFSQDGANYFYDSNVNGTSAEARGTSVAGITDVFSNSFGTWLIGDYAKAFAKYQEYHRLAPKANGVGGALQDIEQVFKVTETTESEYVQADWDSQLFGKRFRGNAGLRGYQTNTRSIGRLQHSEPSNSYAYTGTADVKGSYDGVLPAMNAVLEVTPELLLRFAATQNLNRPSLGSLAAKGNATIDNGVVSASIGNPNLKPFKDDTLDFAAEYYFGKVGMLSASVFHKKITNFIDNQEIFDKVTLDQAGLTGTIAGLPGSTIIHDYQKPINVSGAHSLTGIELAAQSQFSFLPAPFNNFGVVGNVTHVDAPQVFTGISKNSANATLYYETSQYGARVSVNYRSRYYVGHGSGAVSADTQGYEAQTYVDAAAFYNITPKLQVTFDAVNLTNEKNTQFFGQNRYIYNQTQSGATYMLGIGYKF